MIATRFSGLSRTKAAGVLTLLGVAVLAAALASQSAAPVAGAVADPRGGDMALYEAIVTQMRAGVDYYDAAHGQLLANDYGTRSVFNWRLPTLSWLLALLPSLALGQAGLMGLAVLAGGAAGVLLHRAGGWVLAGPGAVLLMLSLAGTFAPGTVLLSEMAAGVLILLSASLYGLGQRRWGMVAGLAALLVRELAGIYILVCLYLAWRERRWSELAAWFALLCAYGLFFAWHYCQVQMHIGASDRAYADGWLQFGGVGFLVATAAFNGFFMVLPTWANGLLLPLALLGLWAWPGRKGSYAGLMVGAALGVFAVLGKPFNGYWGALYTPLLALGLPWLPWAVLDLGKALAGRPQAA